MAQFMAAVEVTIVGTAMPTIVGDLGGFDLLSWVFASYLLPQAVTTPIYGRLADLYGRKRVFFAGTALFLVSSAACGFAWGMVPLIAFRTLQGFGAGAVQPVAWIIIGDIYAPAERARMQGYLSAVFGASSIAGPLLGAFIVEHLNWALVFWVNLPVGLATMVMLWLFLDERLERRRHRVDYLGAGLLMLGVGALMLVVIQVESLSAASIQIFLAVAAVALGALAVQEMRTPEPIIPFHHWRSPVIAVGNFGCFILGAVMMCNAAYLPTYIQGAMGRSPTIAGLALGASSVAWMFGTIAAGRLMVRTSYRATGVIGGLVAIGGSAVFLALEPARGPFLAYFGAAILGLGLGFCNTTFVVAVQTTASWQERGAVVSANMFMRIIGQSLGAGLFGAILLYAWRDRFRRPATRSTACSSRRCAKAWAASASRN